MILYRTDGCIKHDDPECKTYKEIAGKYKYDLSFANFAGANLSGVDLRVANLAGANLVKADLHISDLGGANLALANIAGTNLVWENLAGANLAGANLAWASLFGADLRDADLRMAGLHNANLRGANSRGINFFRSNLIGSDLRDADLRGAKFNHTDIGDAKFTGRIIIKAGSKYELIYLESTGCVHSGCHCMPIAEWERYGETIARKNDYTEEQIEEYRILLQEIKEEVNVSSNKRA